MVKKESPKVATDGREIGARALATRQRLLEATEKLLARDGVLDLKLVDVTREIGSSPATFYQYFSDLDDVLVELADQVTVAAHELAATLDPSWSDVADYEKAHDFVKRYDAYWHDHDAVLRARNLKAEEGDARFRAKRSESQLLVMEALISIVEASVAAGRLPADTDSLTRSAGMLAMLERVTSFRRQIEGRGTTQARMHSTLAEILFHTLSGLSGH